VQTRGSIPLFWRQSPNLKYKPRPALYGQSIETVSIGDVSLYITLVILTFPSQTAACRRHFEELSKHYNKVVVINLIDQKGSELALGEGYENNVRLLNNPSTKYVFIGSLQYLILIVITDI
jgi:phosphatidylinositol 4-phosphatase